VAIENPNELCIGIDESTAILVSGDSATVCGGSQVLVIDASKAITGQTDSLLKAQTLKLDVFSKGDRFSLKK
jgi:cyanophycinase